jgi:hypothetical protein
MMSNAVKLTISVLILAGVACAQDEFDVHDKAKQKWPAQDAHKIYLSACTVVEREFSIHHTVRPRFTLILGADKNGLFFNPREIRLSKWNPELFAQGVVMLAFDDLMTLDERVAMSRRALNWANSTMEVTVPGK